MEKIWWIFGAVLFLALIQNTLCISCYYCTGMTNYDPNDCLDPEKPMSKTFIQECKKGEYCEKKIHRVDHRQDVIDRGCSSNYNGHSYFWSEDFSVYFCKNDNMCNTASSMLYSWTTLTVVTVVSLIAVLFR